MISFSPVRAFEGELLKVDVLLAFIINLYFFHLQF